MAKAGAAHHREPLSGHRAKTSLATFGHTPDWPPYRPIGSPLGRRNFGHWPHSTGCHSGQKGRRAFAYWPPTAPPPATYWPPTGHPGRPYRPPPATKGREGDAYGHTGAPAPHFPATYGQRGATPHWPRTGHKGTAIGGRPSHRPHTGHLRPTWPNEAFGHLHPLPTPGDRDAFGREALPHSPDFRGAVAKGTGRGLACKGRMATGGRAHRLPLGDPLSPYPHRLATYGQKGTGHLRPTPGKGPGPRPTSVPTGH